MQLVITGISLLVIWLAWTRLWQPAWLETTRDKLLDLRDDAENWFAEHGYASDNPVLLELKDMVNRHVFQTNMISFVNFTIFIILDKYAGEYDAFLEKQIKEQFRAGDSQAQEYAEHVRDRISSMLFEYMIFRNLLLSAIYLMLFASCSVYALGKVIGEYVSGSAVPLRLGLCIRYAMDKAMRAMTWLPFHKPFFNHRMEKYYVSRYAGHL